MLLAVAVRAAAAQAAEDEAAPALLDLGALFVVTQKVPFAAAENACLQNGGQLAGMRDAPLADLAGLAEKSATAGATYWVKSHEEGQYAEQCLQFHLGEKAASPSNCAQLQPVLCEKAAARRAGGKACTKHGRANCGRCRDRFNCDVCVESSTSSSSSSSSSSDSCGQGPCDDSDYCQRDYLADLDFYTHYPRLTGERADWSYWTDGQVTADGGSLAFSCKGGLLDSKVYTVTSPQSANPYADHYKYFISANAPVTVPKAGNLVFEFVAAVKTFETDQYPYPEVLISDAGEDVRFAAGVFQVFSTNSSQPDQRNPLTDGLVFSYYLTNDRVYIGYERQQQANADVVPDGKAYSSAYAAFNFLIPVKVRRACDQHDMKIVFNQANRYVSWRLDGREVYRVSKVGYLLNREFMMSDFGGAEGDAFPDLLQYGFGSFTLLDNYPACLRSDSCRSCKFPDVRQALVQTLLPVSIPPNPVVPPYTGQYNPVLGQPSPAVFWDTNGLVANRLWGQGSESAIRRLAVFKESC